MLRTGFSVSDEQEDESSLEDLEAKAKSGDAKAQTKVSGNGHIANFVDCNSRTCQ